MRKGHDLSIRKRFSSYSFGTPDDFRGYVMTATGQLIVPDQNGILVGDGQKFAFRPAPQPHDDFLAAVACPDHLIFITARYGKPNQTPPQPKLMIDVWRAHEFKPFLSIDWSSATFRRGRPSLGESVCSKSGEIYASLFWSTGQPRSIGVGVFHLSLKQKKIEMWEKREGYDGEEEVTPTPLLPDFNINDLDLDQKETLWLSTNSGLVHVIPSKDPKVKAKVKTYGEATGWHTELINDLSFSKGTENQKQETWLATHIGLEHVIHHKLKYYIRSYASAVAHHPQTQDVWVGFRQQIYYGQPGDWTRFPLKGILKRGVIRKLIFQPQGGLWLITDRGIFFTSSMRED